MCVPNWIDIASKLATPTIAAISAFYVYLQYKRAQRWKAKDLAAKQLERLETDPTLELVCLALDWGTGPLLIPERYKPLFPLDASGDAPGVMDHDTTVLSIALEPILNQKTLRDPRGLVYRHCFVRFFMYLDNIFRLLEDGQLLDEDITSLTYWLEMLGNYRYAPNGKDPRLVFLPALRKWDYSNVILLACRLKVKVWTSQNTPLTRSATAGL